MGGSLFRPWLAGSVPSCVEHLLLKQVGWFVWKSQFLFRSSKWHWPVCSCGQTGVAFRELRWPEETTAILGHLTPSQRCCSPLALRAGWAGTIRGEGQQGRLLPGPCVQGSVLDSTLLAFPSPCNRLLPGAVCR